MSNAIIYGTFSMTKPVVVVHLKVCTIHESWLHDTLCTHLGMWLFVFGLGL